jgi:hypothetical protein
MFVTNRCRLAFVFGLTVCLTLFAAAAICSADSTGRYVEYRHPIGVEFKHPQTWSVIESALGLQINPPDAQSNHNGPIEAHFFQIIGADPSVASLADPKAAHLLNNLVTQMLPFLQPKGTGRAVGKEGGRVFTWNGRSPEGLNVQCDVYGILRSGYFISLTSLGDAQLVSRRKAEIVETFKTLQLREPQADPRHASTWYSNSFSSSGSYGNRVSTNTQNTMTLLPNGRLTSTAQTSVHGWTKDHKGTDHASISGLTEGSTEEGRWAVSGSNLYLLWKDVGVVKWSIYIQGNPGRREMLLTPASGGKGVLWTEYPDF